MLSILTEAELAKTYQIFPLQVKLQLSNYLQFLIAQYHIEIPSKTVNTNKTIQKRQSGGLEVKIWMSDDFNEYR